MIQKAAEFLKRRSKTSLTAMAFVSIVLLGVLDYWVGIEIHFALFYLIPIFIASWFISGIAGIFAAIFAALTWFLADTIGGRSYSSIGVASWILFTRTLIFAAFAVTQTFLRSKLDELSNLAGRDFLTGLPNGHAFYQLTAVEMNRAFGIEPMTLVCIDVTGFKWINHRFGYPSGDQMMCTITHTIKQNVPRPDLVGRLGGTSFAVLLPNIASDVANLVLQRVQNALHEERRKYAYPLTFFISAIACTKAPRTVAELMQEADAQMARIKGGRRDSLQIARVDNLPALH